MKLLCNLHPVGASAHGTVTRTGIFRVVEHLVRGVAAAPDCEAFFHAAGNLWQSWRYYEEHLRGPRTRFVVTPWRVRLSRHLSPLERFTATTMDDRRLHVRAARFAFTRYVSRATPLIERIDERVLGEIDVYHSPFLTVPAAVRRYPRVQRFTTVYDLIPLSHPQFFNPGVVRTIRAVADGFDAADHVLCISEATRTALLEHAPRLDPARVDVTPLAAGPAFYPEIDPARIAAVRRRVGLPPDAPYFLSLCTLEPRKNLDAVVRCFARLKQERRVDRETRLVLVGNLGWKTEKIFSALEDARACRDSILLTGFVPDEQLAPLYSDALGFVYLSWMEGFGLPPLEAMQCGVPVICSNTSSLPEVVGDAGLLLAPDDLDGITGAMAALATDATRRHDLSARSLARARLFSWERFVQQNLDAYKKALANG